MILHAFLVLFVFVASLTRLAHRDNLSFNQRLGMVFMTGGAIVSFIAFCNTGQFHFWAEQALLLGVVMVALEGAWRIDTRRRGAAKKLSSQSPARARKGAAVR